MVYGALKKGALATRRPSESTRAASTQTAAGGGRVTKVRKHNFANKRQAFTEQPIKTSRRTRHQTKRDGIDITAKKKHWKWKVLGFDNLKVQSQK